jgi:hypothetical protein
MAVTYTDRQILKKADAGAAASFGCSDPITAVAQAHSSIFTFSKASDDAMASTTTSETYTGIYFPYACKLKAVTYVATTGGVTADASNYATVTVSKRDSAAANLTTVATLTTTVASSGSITQGAGKGLVLSGSAVNISAGSTVTFSVAKTGTGVVLRAGVFSLEVEFD